MPKKTSKKKRGGSKDPDLNKLRAAISPDGRVRMTPERRGEIALLLLKEEMRKSGIHFQDVKDRINSAASQPDVSSQEAHEFCKLMVKELVDEAFKAKPYQGVRSSRNPGSSLAEERHPSSRK